MSKGNGQKPLTADQLRQLRPLSAGDYYWAKTKAPRQDDGEISGEDFAFYALAHAARRKGLVDGDDVYAFLDRIELPVLFELAGELADEMKEAQLEGPLPKTPTGRSQRSATSGG